MKELKTELLPHQQRVVDRLRNQRGLLVAHGLGTGKSLASIAAAQDTPGNTEVLVPAALQENYKKELQKHLGALRKIKVHSAPGAVLRDEAPPADLLVVDEAHRARETSTGLYKLLEDYPAAKKLLLTASPVYNRPSDIAPLVNIVAQNKVLPTGKDFSKKYVYKPNNSLLRVLFRGVAKPKIRNEAQLRKVLNEWVDYHQQSGGNFPRTVEEDITVPMNKSQTKLHDFSWGKLPLVSRMRLRAGLPPNKKDLPRLNAFQSQSRQLSGSTKRFDKSKDVSPKIRSAVGNLQSRLEQSPDHRAVVYSNYLDTLGDYSEELERSKIPHAIFNGRVSLKDRKKMVDDYNKGKLKALLISSAGGEGLDLKGTRQLQVLEPHWNTEKLKQVTGRAVRHGSHEHLPKEQREVLIQRYTTHPRPGLLNKMFKKTPRGVEQVLSDLSKNKEELNQQLLKLLEAR